MSQRLTPMAVVLLTIAPLLWAGNAIAGRIVAPWVSPMTLNLLRWCLAGLLLLPLAGGVLKPGSALWKQWRWFAWASLFSIGAYNALQYLALTTSTPINVTLVGASTPIWMLLIGRIFFATSISVRQTFGAILSIAGVVLVLSRGDWQTLWRMRLVAGDVYMLLASMAWAYYSWLISRSGAIGQSLPKHWAAPLLGQIAFGLVWSSAFTAAEWLWTPAHVEWSGALLGLLAYIAIGPAITAYAAWGAGVARAGPAVAGMFMNLTPLFAAVMSAAFLGELPQIFHAIAFVLIVFGIILGARK